MHLMSRGAPTHSGHLERWLGAENAARVSDQMKDFYWPVALHGVPGNVYAMPGGDFAGEIKGGQFGSAFDRAHDAVQRYHRAQRAKLAEHRIASDLALRSKMDHRRHAFASLSALITAGTTGGKKQDLPPFYKTGAAANTIGSSNDLWTRGGFPAAGGAGFGAPGGSVWTNASLGAIPIRYGASSNSNHFVGGWVTASVINNSLLLYDRLFSVNKTMNSTAAEAVTGVPTRYQSSTATDIDYAGGNFITLANPTTVLAATAHNVTAASTAVWNYTSEAGITGRNLNHNGTAIQTQAGVSACVVSGIDLAGGNWFIPLQAFDIGIKSLQQMQLSAAIATGTLQAIIGHPIAVFPCPVANLVCQVDGVNTAFNLTPIMDFACLTFIELPKSATTATNYSGQIYVVSE